MQNRKFTLTYTEKQAISAEARSCAAKRFLGLRAVSKKPVKAGRFRMTTDELSTISKRGADLLLNASPEDMNNYRKWQ